MRELAETNPFAASLLAERGTTFSPLENLLNLYFKSLEKWNRIQSGEKTVLEESMGDAPNWETDLAPIEYAATKQAYENLSSQIIQTVMDAINNRDADKIFDLAQAMEFLNGFKPDGDPARAKILMEKVIWKNDMPKWTIAQLARIIGWQASDREHGFPHLRRLCKDLKFPLKPSRRISKK